MRPHHLGAVGWERNGHGDDWGVRLRVGRFGIVTIE